MRRYIYTLFFAAIIVSCKNKSGKQRVVDSSDVVAKKVSTNYHNPLFSQYAGYLKKKDDKTAASATDAVNKFIELFRGADTATCDTAFLIFDKFYKKVTESLEDVNEKDDIDLDKYYGYVDKPKDAPSKVLAYVDELKRNGFRIDESEGSMYITQDWDFVEKHFDGVVSPTMKDFITEINIENKQSYMEDGSLTIGADTLVDRAVWWDRFEKQHPNFISKNEVSTTKKEYLNVLLKGSDNTEIFHDNNLDDYFKAAFTHLQKKYPETETYKLAKPIYELLMQSKKTEADNLLKQYDKRGLLFD